MSGVLLLAFDVDGTLDTSNGPVPWARVKRWANMGPPDLRLPMLIILGIVSPSGARPKDDTPAYLSPSGIRSENLTLFANAWPPGLKLYVSDNGDLADAAVAGFALITPVDFTRAFRG